MKKVPNWVVIGWLSLQAFYLGAVPAEAFDVCSVSRDEGSIAICKSEKLQNFQKDLQLLRERVGLINSLREPLLQPNRQAQSREEAMKKKVTACKADAECIAGAYMEEIDYHLEFLKERNVDIASLKVDSRANKGEWTGSSILSGDSAPSSPNTLFNGVQPDSAQRNPNPSNMMNNNGLPPMPQSGRLPQMSLPSYPQQIVIPQPPQANDGIRPDYRGFGAGSGSSNGTDRQGEISERIGSMVLYDSAPLIELSPSTPGGTANPGLAQSSSGSPPTDGVQTPVAPPLAGAVQPPPPAPTGGGSPRAPGAPPQAGSQTPVAPPPAGTLPPPTTPPTGVGAQRAPAAPPQAGSQTPVSPPPAGAVQPPPPAPTGGGSPRAPGAPPQAGSQTPVAPPLAGAVPPPTPAPTGSGAPRATGAPAQAGGQPTSGSPSRVQP